MNTRRQFLIRAPLAALVGAATITAVAAQIDSPPLSPTELFVKQVFEDRLTPNGVPDIGLVLKSPRIIVHRELTADGLKMTDRLLPRREGYTFDIKSPSEVQAEADGTGKAIYFLEINGPILNDDSATIWLGVGGMLPRGSKEVLLCCCHAMDQFRRVDGRWQFVKRLHIICS